MKSSEKKAQVVAIKVSLGVYMLLVALFMTMQLARCNDEPEPTKPVPVAPACKVVSHLGISVIDDKSPNVYQVLVDGEVVKEFKTQGGVEKPEVVHINLEGLELVEGMYDIEFRTRPGDSRAAFTSLRLDITIEGSR